MLAPIVFPELKSYSLGFVSDALKLPHEPKHRALGDVRATAMLLAACFERFTMLPAEAQDIIKIWRRKVLQDTRNFLRRSPAFLPQKKHFR
jgi:DNA polymerase III epsilon subunit-like protein